jgi:Tfp pilus tip-associated adhesin PilY1
MKTLTISRNLKYILVGAMSLSLITVFAARLTLPAKQPLNYIAAGDLNTFNLGSTSPTPVAYSPWFENGAWQGNLIAKPVSDQGVIGASVIWQARDVFADPLGADTNDVSATYWSDTSGTDKRIIITTTGGSGGWTDNAPGDDDKVPFRYNDYSANPAPLPGTVLTQSQQDSIAATVTDQEKIINFARGDRSNENISATQAASEPGLPANSAGTLRERYSILGDIIHSTPQYVGAPDANYVFNNYASFQSSNSGRAGRVYVGANDGMLHGFDAANGQEVFAYVPSMVIGNLQKLSALNYKHTYFVDGELAAGDAYAAFPACGGGSCWRTVLVGGLGAGGKGFYALDVTDPVTTSDTESAVRANILWEVGAPYNSADPELGYTFSRPTITRLKTGQWVAIAGNGYDNTNGKAVLYLIDMTVIDSDFDGDADFVYAGDLNGDMWRFDLTGVGNPVTAGAVSAYKLYDGSPAQPITAAPDVSTHPDGGFLVFFGTGRAFNTADLADPTAQAIYGIHDQGAALSSPTLVTQTLTFGSYGGVTPSLSIRTSTSNPVNYASADGWKVDLPAGERLLGHLQVRGDRVQLMTTNITNTPYENWLMQLDYLTGGSPLFTVFDLNRDSVLNTADDAGGNIVAAFKVNEGVTAIQVASQPIIAFKSSGKDVILVNSLGLVVSCTINCSAGFAGGHIDVDTDSPNGGTISAGGAGLGGNTDGHVHEYDKKHGQVLVDYFSLEPLGQGKLNRVTDVFIGATQTFLVLIANGDYSPGGMLTIGSAAPVNVKDYQDALINKIQTNSLTVADLHTIDELQGTTLPGNDPVATGETIAGALRISFTDTSIATGGLHPTNTGCVNKDNALINYHDRWRNGALTLHLIPRPMA